MAVEAGTRVGRFVICEYIGDGELGRVFRATAPDTGSVAVKLLRGLADARATARLRPLAQRLVALRHPNLAAVLEFGTHDDVPYLVTQHAGGGSLAALLRSVCLDRAAALRLLRGVAAGIDHAHRVGLVHGALRPEQVVLDTGDRPLVTDVGLAALVRPQRGGVAAAAAVSRPTAAADRRAFAALAYQLLAGRPPSPGARLDGGPLHPSALRPRLGPRVDEVLLRGLGGDPMGGRASCTELVDALAAVLAPAVHPEPSPARRARESWWSRAAMGCAAALVLTAGSAAAWLSGPVPAIEVRLSSATATVGDAIELEATGLPPGRSGTVRLGADAGVIGTFQADGAGHVRAVLTIPERTVPGFHLVSLSCAGGCQGAAGLVVMQRAPAAVPPGGATALGGAAGPNTQTASARVAAPAAPTPAPSAAAPLVTAVTPSDAGQPPSWPDVPGTPAPDFSTSPPPDMSAPAPDDGDAADLTWRDGRRVPETGHAPAGDLRSGP